MTATNHFLFELGCEELPPKSLKRLSQALLDSLLTSLQDAGLSYTRPGLRDAAAPGGIDRRFTDFPGR